MRRVDSLKQLVSPPVVVTDVPPPRKGGKNSSSSNAEQGQTGTQGLCNRWDEMGGMQVGRTSQHVLAWVAVRWEHWSSPSDIAKLNVLKQFQPCEICIPFHSFLYSLHFPCINSWPGYQGPFLHVTLKLSSQADN